jgi:hypothetical protein
MKRLALRRPDSCAICSAELPAGAIAVWDATSKTVTCDSCAHEAQGAAAHPLSGPAAGSVVEPARDGAGGSLEREYERRRSGRERRARERHPHIGGLLLALNGEPQHQLAFRQGAKGEHAVAEYLEQRTIGTPTILLHNRRMPGGRGDIDHIAITSSGVYVIDTKSVIGKVEIRRPWFGQPKLTINGRDRSSYIDGLDRQTQAVRDAVVPTEQSAIRVQGVLCFTKAHLPLIGTLEMRGHLLLYRKALSERLNADGALVPKDIRAAARQLAQALRPA